MLTAETWNASRLDAMISSKIEENFSLDYKAAGAIGDSEKANVKSQKMFLRWRIPVAEQLFMG